MGGEHQGNDMKKVAETLNVIACFILKREVCDWVVGQPVPPCMEVSKYPALLYGDDVHRDTFSLCYTTSGGKIRIISTGSTY